jgi:CRISPR-associated endoribonuclease Cas6
MALTAGDPPTLRSVVVFLEPGGPLRVPADSGPLVHRWFFRMLVRYPDGSGDLAGTLHERAVFKPFTLSPLVRLPRDAAPTALDPCPALRVTSVDPRLSRWLGHLEAEQLDTVRVGPSWLRAVAVATDATVSTWADAVTFEALARRWQEAGSVPDRVTLHFVSPTAFRQDGHNVIFPLEAEVFRSLARKWRQFAPPGLALPPALEEPGLIHASRYELQSVYRADGEFPQKAFQGWCEYVIDRRAEQAVACGVQMLADFAFYAGVGSMTTMGMGQVVARRRK